ncbi:alpha/beta hydrolase [Mariniflexile ostreae]|uniref:Alpha/beta hydrolase n=1 Tax=Mariniflexile ostreae TaxID=1520892 RepID=A0ABV5FAE6_9FLAO
MIPPVFNPKEILALWDYEIPNSQTSDEVELIENKDIIRISKVQIPTLEVYLPAKRSNTGKAVLICPGGGYSALAYDWEGTDVAKWFNTKGIAAFVLKYRLPDSRSVTISHEAPLQDAQRAMRLVRNHAKQWGVDPAQVGIIGFSAGGHLAATLGTQFDSKTSFKEDAIDSLSARPDFMVLVYPVITMKNNYTHLGSRNKLLGEAPSEALIQKFSNEMHVTRHTPPTFLVHSGDDKAVPVENSLQFYQALKSHHINAEMHVYPYGGHGYGLAIGRGRLQTWVDRLADWLEHL